MKKIRKRKKEDRRKHAEKRERQVEEKRIFEKEVQEHPELYVEVNIIKSANGMIESQYLYAKERKFKYEGFTYHLKPEGLILTPTKDNGESPGASARKH